MKTNCLFCGNENPKHGMKTCSRKCADELKKINSREKRTCIYCKNQFEIRKKDDRKLCSEECRKLWAALPENINTRIQSSKIAVKEKFGVDNVFQLDDVKNKIKQTILKEYGVENPAQNEEVKQKMRDTNMLKFGTEYASQNEDIKLKVKKTVRERFGVDHHLQLPEIMGKQIKTNLERHGVEFPGQSQISKNKIKDTNLKKYGVENVSQNEEIKQKKKDTSMENFGVSHHLKDGGMFLKHQKAQYRVKTYKDTNLYYNGSYEKYFLETIEEKGFLNEVQQGESFEYQYKGETHVYHTDFTFRGKQIEIKSGWTYNKNGADKELQELNESKWKVVKDLVVLIGKSEISGFIKAL